MADQPQDSEVDDPILKTRAQGAALLRETVAAYARGQLRAFAIVGVDDKGRAIGALMSSDADMQVLSDGLVRQSSKLLSLSTQWDDCAPENNRSTDLN